LIHVGKGAWLGNEGGREAGSGTGGSGTEKVRLQASMLPLHCIVCCQCVLMTSIRPVCEESMGTVWSLESNCVCMG